MTGYAVADDGCRLWTSIHGDGAPLVLCHGGPGLWDYLGDVAALLARVARVTRWDQRGGGRSDIRGPYTVARFVMDLDAVRERTGAPRVALLGHSWGATLALRYTLVHPDRVTGLVYVSGTGIDPPSTWREQHSANVRRRLGEHLARWEALRQHTRTHEEEREYAMLSWATDFADPVTATAHAHSLATPWFGVNDECNKALSDESAGADLADRCRVLTVPVLIVDGDSDNRPRWSVDSLNRALPHVRQITLPSAGHLPWVERPDEFTDAVTGFLTTLTSASG